MKIVISGVNLVEGGLLSIIQDCIVSLEKNRKLYNLEIIVLVHDKNLIKDICNQDNLKIFEYPKIKSSWFRRLYFEFVYCRKLSNQLKPDIWFSLHDITPSVNCDFQVVYCHNASQFYTPKKEYFFYDITFSLFNLFYKYLYQINIKKNAWVIVQQNWLRDEFKKMYNINTIVAYPLQSAKLIKLKSRNIDYIDIDYKKTTFFFPSIPRVFKNFEIVCEAVQILEQKIENFEVILTLNGNENKYANMIFKKYRHIKSLKFIGVQERGIIQVLYSKVDCLIFPSKLESWGLPISEFKLFDKPILVSDLPYAHENIGSFDKAKFFNPENAEELALYMMLFIERKLIYDIPKPIIPNFPFFENWDDLLAFLILQSQIKKTSINFMGNHKF
jgi:glycosyltransferase involved in cell wall biosynthesis